MMLCNQYCNRLLKTSSLIVFISMSASVLYTESRSVYRCSFLRPTIQLTRDGNCVLIDGISFHENVLLFWVADCLIFSEEFSPAYYRLCVENIVWLLRRISVNLYLFVEHWLPLLVITPFVINATRWLQKNKLLKHTRESVSAIVTFSTINVYWIPSRRCSESFQATGVIKWQRTIVLCLSS